MCGTALSMSGIKPQTQVVGAVWDIWNYSPGWSGGRSAFVNLLK